LARPQALDRCLHYSPFRRCCIRLTRYRPVRFYQGKHCLPFDEQQCAQVISIEIDQIERNEHALTAAEQQITEYWPASIINAGNLTVEDGALEGKTFSDPGGEISEATECISVS
jgi:hypothetical protein